MGIKARGLDLPCMAQLVASATNKTGVRLTGFTIWALFLSSCTSIETPILDQDLADRVENVDTLSLPDESKEPPVSVDDAEGMIDEEAIRAETAPVRMELKIEEVRRAALENNLDLDVELARPAINRAVLDEERARFEALFFASGSVQDTDPPDERTEPGVDLTRTEAEMGIEIPLRTGGTAVVNLPVTSVDPDVPGASDQVDTSVGFSISQPLLRNAGTGVNTSPITIAELQYRQDQAQTKLGVIGVLANAGTAYWEHYAASRALEVRYEQYQRALDQKRQAQRLAEEGVVPEIEVTRANSNISRRVDDIIVARTRRSIAERNLKRIMNRPGLDMESITALIPGTDPRPLRLVLDRRSLAQFAVDNRMELLNLKLQLAVDSVTLDQASNQTLPDLALDYTYSKLGRDTAFNSSLDAIFDDEFSDWRIGLSLEVPLGNKAAKARERRARLRKILTLRTRAQRRQAIRQEVYDSVDQLEQSWLQVLAAREDTLVSGKTYEAEKRQFLAGVRTSTDVLDAADRLADAQIREVQALASYEIAKIDTATATGTLLGKGRVRLYREDRGGSTESSEVTDEPPAMPITANAAMDTTRPRNGRLNVKNDTEAE